MLYIYNITRYYVFYIQHTRSATTAHTMTTKEQLAETQKRYLQAAVLGQTADAQTIIDDATTSGSSAIEIYLSVLTPAQVRLGEMWHQGKINAAQEHLATAITMQMMDLQRQSMKPHDPRGLRAVVTPVQGDTHFIGARMLADILIMDGWDVDFFWNPAPTKDLAEYMKSRNVDLLALSATMPQHLPNATKMADTIRQLNPNKPKIILGGAALNTPKPEAVPGNVIPAHHPVIPAQAGNHQPQPTPQETPNPLDLGVDAVLSDLNQAAAKARSLVGYSETKPSLEQQLTTIGRNIRAARTRNKATQQQLADQAGLDRTYVSLVEHGRQNLTIAAALKIAHALNINLQDLLTTNPLRKT